MYVLVISREVEAEQSHLNDDGLSPNERQRIRDEKEKARTQKQVEADLGGFDIEQEWVEEIEREDCFEIDLHLGLAPPMIERKYEVWLVDASSRWSVVDKYELGEFEHGTALSVLYLTDVSPHVTFFPFEWNELTFATSVLTLYLVTSWLKGCRRQRRNTEKKSLCGCRN